MNMVETETAWTPPLLTDRWIEVHLLLPGHPTALDHLEYIGAATACSAGW